VKNFQNAGLVTNATSEPTIWISHQIQGFSKNLYNREFKNLAKISLFQAVQKLLSENFRQDLKK
jgi:hypothetical protein